MNPKVLPSKTVSITFLFDEIRNDPSLFSIPDEVNDKIFIRDVLLKKYHTEKGKLSARVEDRKIILDWVPDKIDDGAEMLHHEAMELVKSKQYDKAILKWKQAALLNDSDLEYFYKLGLVFYEQKKYLDSTDSLQQAVKICPIHQKSHLLLGIDLIKLKRLDLAETHLLECKRLNPSNILSYLNLGAIYTLKKKLNEAIEMYNTAIRIYPKESRAYLGLAKIYQTLNGNEASKEHYKKVIELSPDSALSEYAKKALLQQNIIHKKLQVSVPKREERIAKGIGFYLSGNYQLSAKNYKEYLNTQPSDDYVWYLLGETKLRTGAINDTVDCFRRAIRLNSQKSLYYKSIGLALHQQGKLDEAGDHLKKAIDMGKNDTLVLLFYGINLYKQKKIEDAIYYLKQVFKKDPNNPMALFYYALILIQKQEKVTSKLFLEKLIKIEYYAPIKEQARKVLINIENE